MICEISLAHFPDPGADTVFYISLKVQIVKLDDGTRQTFELDELIAAQGSGGGQDSPTQLPSTQAADDNTLWVSIQSLFLFGASGDLYKEFQLKSSSKWNGDTKTVSLLSDIIF